MSAHQPVLDADPVPTTSTLGHELRLALQSDEIIPYYQPQVDLTTGVVAGFETLVRWHHPTRGFVRPDSFVPLAEATGLCIPMDQRILAEACRHYADWRTRFPDLKAPTLAVNLSTGQFASPDLVSTVATTIADAGFAPGELMLEVHKTAALAQPEVSIPTFAALRELGVRLAIDDYGTGRSTLADVPRLPVDTLKIDPSFFRARGHNRTLVRVVTTLAQGLGLQVIAEGLETEAHIQWAREVGCHLAQGYYFGRPLLAEQCEKLWADGLHFPLP